MVRVVAGVVLLAVVAGAAGAPVPKQDPTPTAADYYPARKGDKRVYEVRDQLSPGTPTSVLEVVVTAVERTGDGMVVRTALPVPGGKPLRFRTEVVSDRGVGLAEEMKNRTAPPVPLLRLPPGPAGGEAFTATLAGTVEVKGTVVAHPEEAVEVLAGKYRAVRTEVTGTADGKSFRRTSWYSRGVGLVREVYTSETQFGVTRHDWVLKSFTAGEP